VVHEKTSFVGKQYQYYSAAEPHGNPFFNGLILLRRRPVNTLTYETTLRIPRGVVYHAGQLFNRVSTTLRLWQWRYRERQHLLGLDERLLKDIGWSRADIAREAAKPFWRE
jgi:uncharacterized protein YjiS (DUF1127 family)